jgi:hypothetical protein
MEAQPNYNRMLKIIEDVFTSRIHSNQIQVTENDIEKLYNIHPSTLTELSDENGPTCWILIIPTTNNNMIDFINDKISEQQLLDKTNSDEILNCLYLCSAITLPEYRNKDITLNACLESAKKIINDFPIESLYVWPLSIEGKTLASKISKQLNLPLHLKEVNK